MSKASRASSTSDEGSPSVLRSAVPASGRRCFRSMPIGSSRYGVARGLCRTGHRSGRHSCSSGPVVHSRAGIVANGTCPPNSSGLGRSLPGLSVREAIASRSFWLLGLGFPGRDGREWHGGSRCIFAERPRLACRCGGSHHDLGWARECGRSIDRGLSLDRLFAPYVALLSFLVGLAGLYFLASDTSPVLGVIGVGLTTGAEIDIIAYMTSRYFGLRQFGQLYGYCSAFSLLVQARVPRSWVCSHSVTEL